VATGVVIAAAVAVIAVATAGTGAVVTGVVGGKR
jgi:hypothetical protein